MPCSEGNISYKIQSGDTLYRIASKFNTTVSEILSANLGINPNKIYIGQEICIPFKQPTLQIADQPILVNGVNINTGLYPVLNYKPAGAEYPYIYVPIAEFSKVGAVVNWDDVNQLLSVTTDYYTNKGTISELQAKVSDLQSQIDELKSLPPESNNVNTNVSSNSSEPIKIDVINNPDVVKYITVGEQQGEVQKGSLLQTAKFLVSFNNFNPSFDERIVSLIEFDFTGTVRISHKYQSAGLGSNVNGDSFVELNSQGLAIGTHYFRIYVQDSRSYELVFSNLFEFKVSERITISEFIYYQIFRNKIFANEDNQVEGYHLRISAIASKEEADMTVVKWCDENGTELSSEPKGLTATISLYDYDAEEQIVDYNITLVGNQAKAGSYYFKVITNKNKSLLTAVTVHDMQK